MSSPSDVVGVSGTDSTAQPPDERLTNRSRRPKPRKSARAPFPLMAEKESEGPVEVRRTAVMGNTDLDTSDPAAGGGRSFTYEWERADRVLEEQIQTVAAGGGISYVHTQSVPAATWVIDHHMSLIPNVLILDFSGQQMIAEVRHPSDQTTVVVHSAPYTGTAYLRP